MKTIDKIITKVNTEYGAPMGRPDVNKQSEETTHGKGAGNFTISNTEAV